MKKAESEQIVVALRDRGFPVEYLLASDERHGFARPVNNLAAFAAAERFLAMHLDGRYQEGGSPEVMQRLEEITVDPATVELPDGLDTGEPFGRLLSSGHALLAWRNMTTETQACRCQLEQQLDEG